MAKQGQADYNGMRGRCFSEGIRKTEDNMLPAQIEFFAREHQATLLEEAEQQRLLKIITTQPASGDTTTWPIRCWLGAQLVEWGFKLQGYRAAPLPQLLECEPCNC